MNSSESVTKSKGRRLKKVITHQDDHPKSIEKLKNTELKIAKIETKIIKA